MRDFRMMCRLASLLCYGLSLFIVHQVHPIAAKAYNDLCSSQGVTFGEGRSVNFLGITLVVFAIPLFLARNHVLIITNLVIGLITILGAISLLYTAGDTPYECFTQAGTYEDHTSGLDGFELWFCFAALLSYVLLLVDLAIWCVRKLIASESISSERTRSNLTP
jgi:hypothetical protein